MKFEDAFHEAGTFGPSQKWMICVCLIIFAYSGWPQTTTELIEFEVPFGCVRFAGIMPSKPAISSAATEKSSTESATEEKSNNNSIEDRQRRSLKGEDSELDSTTQGPVDLHAENSSQLFYDNNKNYTTNEHKFNSENHLPSICYAFCEHLYEDRGKSSIFSSFNLGCSKQRQFFQTLLNSSSSIGIICSSFITGIIADKMGRRSTLLPFLFLLLLVLFLTPFAPDMKTFIALKVSIAFFTFGILLLIFVATIESCAQKNNPRLSAFLAMSGNLGHISAAITFNYVTSWRVQMYIIAALLPFIIILSYFKIPESARWLHAVGYVKESEIVLKKIAEHNGVSSGKISMSVRIRNFAAEFTENEDSLLDSDEDLHSGAILRNQNTTTDFAQPKNINIFDLFGTSNSSLVMIFNIISWTCVAVTLKHLAPMVNLPSHSPFMTKMFIASVQTSCILISFPLNSMGRKIVSLFCIVGTSFATTAFLYYQSVFGDSGIINLIIASLVAQIALWAFVSFYIYTAEQMPTALRCTGLSLCIGLAETTSLIHTLSPDFPNLSHLIAPIILSSGVLAIFVGYFFGPETKHKSMPHTIEQFYALVE